jgi:hypothetical protein
MSHRTRNAVFLGTAMLLVLSAVIAMPSTRRYMKMKRM